MTGPPDELRRDQPAAGVDARVARIAAEVADGGEVDWGALQRTHPELGPLLYHLATLSEIAARHRRELSGQGTDSAADHPLDASYAGHSGPLRALERAADNAVVLSHGLEQGRVGAEAPAHWGALEIRERIGEGSFGEVFRAFDPQLQREVALKLARPSGAQGATAADLHLDEARRLARVRHPNVLAIHGVETHDGRTGLWTDLLHGTTLAEMFERGTLLSREELLRVGIQLCRALQAIHEAGLIHGDVKAANVFSEPNGSVVLMDFGAGRPRHDPGSGGSSLADLEASSGPLFGTPIVLAPEVLEGTTPTVSADVYSLGVLLYKGASGRYPVEASTLIDLVLEHRREERIPLAELRPDLPEVITRAVDRAIARNPSARFETAAQFESSLAIASDGAGGASPEAWERELPPGVPEPATRFLGRKLELERIQSQVDRGGYCTLVGPGGSGKTRLAVEVARRFGRRYPDGLYWIDLVPVLDAGSFLSAVASRLGIRLRSNQSERDALLEFLAGRSTLLILDNVEHLRGAVRDWARDVLASCPRVVLLVTSRERLDVEGEVVVEVGPMELPEVGAVVGAASDSSAQAAGTDSSAQMAASDAVRLFLDRAAHADRGFRPTPSRLEAVARIVRQVDGLPLAIELAAARVVSMDVEEIASRLERSASLLGASGRTGARHETMAAALEWSWSLLEPGEQTLLRRFAVFRGGATLVALEHAAAEPSAPADAPLVPAPESLGPTDVAPPQVQSPERARIEGREVFELLDGLVRKSLVRLERGRYRLYEVVRQFAAEKLQESGEVDAVERRFLRHFLALAIEAERRLYGEDQERWATLFDEESGNLEAALALAGRPDCEPDAGLRLAASLGRYWADRGLMRHGLRRLRAQLERPDGEAAPTAHRADALNWAGNLATGLADYPLAARFHQEGEAVQRSRGFLPGVGTALGGLGDALYRMGEVDRARACLEENIEIQRREGRPIQLGMALTKLAVLCEYEGELDRAATLHEEGLMLARQRGDHARVALSLTGLGKIHLLKNDLVAALTCFSEALAIRRRLNDRVFMSTTLNLIANTHIVSGRPEEALPHVREALRLQESAPRPMSVYQCLEILSLHADSCGRVREGLALLSAAWSVRESTGEVLSEGARRHLEGQALALRAKLDPQDATDAWVSGKVLTVSDAIALGMGYVDAS